MRFCDQEGLEQIDSLFGYMILSVNNQDMDAFRFLSLLHSCP